jgi:hypothetical protein
MEYCPLCRLDPAEHDLLWRAEQQGGYDQAGEQATQLGVAVGRRELRRHFEYHYPRQARPRSLSNKKALELMENGTERRRKIADLLFRVPGLRGPTVGMAVHWAGDPDKLVSADKAAQRDLRQMLNADSAHRIYLPNLSGPAARPVDLRGYFFLGANARGYIEDLYSLNLRPKDWLSDQFDLGDWRSIYPRITAQNLLGEQQVALAGRSDLSWSPRNWIGSHLLPRFENPYSLASRVQSDGMAALTVGDQILPFFYLVDNGSRPLDHLIRELNAPLGLQQSNQQLDFFPDISPDLVIPIIVVSTSKQRHDRLREINPGFDHSGLLALACQELSFIEPNFVELFRSGSQQPRALPELLIEHYRQAPVPGPLLRFRR